MSNYTDNQSQSIEKLDLIFSDCVVEFRPLNNWEGEYGFDWYRRGDFIEIIKGEKIKSNYEKIVGKYDSTDPDTPIFFSNLDYKRKLFSEYPKLKYYDLMEKEYFSYYSPFINLFYKSIIDGKLRLPTILLDNKEGKNVLKAQCKTDAKLKVIINAKHVDRIEFEYDKRRLKVEPSVIHVPDGKSEQEIIIRYLYDDYKSDFDEYLSINAIAYYKKGAIVVEKNGKWVSRACAGQLNVVRCIPRKINIRFVVILSRFNSGVRKPNKKPSRIYVGNNKFVLCENERESLCKILAQANVIPSFDVIHFPETKQKELDTILNKYKVRNNNRGYSIKLSRNSTIVEELDDLLLGKSEVDKDRYGGFYYVYIINEHADSSLGLAHLPGRSAVVLQKDSDECTVSHELLHCLGLYHSFSNKSKHTFEKKQTSNVMDYTNGYTLWKWQWKQINDALKPKSNGR